MIVPALLTDQRDKLIAMLETCSKFADYIQLDIMDGAFVPSKSVSRQDLEGIKFPRHCEAHLMVSDPLAWLESFKESGVEKIIYHFEIEANQKNIISEIKSQGFKAGLAVNPETQISDFESLVSDIDSVLFMSVNPGFYGADFIPKVLEKIQQFKTSYPKVLTGIDGGVKLSNLKMVKNSGVDYICVGSAILNSDDPKSAYQKLVEAANG